ncbi:MAG: hypothetical protein CSA83_01570 [Actinomycetales bacterium]|nr:MAG: hypothetical protein CSA83_01570 [Actinomycetales bacterium]
MSILVVQPSIDTKDGSIVRLIDAIFAHFNSLVRIWFFAKKFLVTLETILMAAVFIVAAVFLVATFLGVSNAPLTVGT